MSDRRPVKVLQVVSALGMGGAETWLMEVLRLWSRTGAGRMDFLLTGGKRDLFDDEASRLGADLHYVQYSRAGLATFVRRFRRILADGGYDAIHDHSDYACGWRFLLGAGALPPVRVAHVHNTWIHIAAYYGVSPGRRLTARLGKQLVERLATHVCGTSGEVLDRYGFRSGRARGPSVGVLHCGIDAARFAAPSEPDRASVLREFDWDEDARLVLFAGRLDQALTFDHPRNIKNSWFALNAVRAAFRKDPSVRFLMAGAGDGPRADLDRRIHEWGLQRELRVIGVRRDMPRLMNAANVLLFPSREEGLGMAAVEAQAAGLPVLASTGVPRECVVVPDLYEALPLTDSIEAWADALLRRMNRPHPSREACRLAIDSSPFSIANSARRLQEIYTSS